MNTYTILIQKGLYDDVISVIIDFLYGSRKHNKDKYYDQVVYAIHCGHNLTSAYIKLWNLTDYMHAMMYRNDKQYNQIFENEIRCECCISVDSIIRNNMYYKLNINRLYNNITNYLRVFPDAFEKTVFDGIDIKRLQKVMFCKLPFKTDDHNSWVRCGECYNIFYENVSPDDVGVTPYRMKHFYALLQDKTKVNRFYIGEYLRHEKIFDTINVFPLLEVQGYLYDVMKDIVTVVTE